MRSPLSDDEIGEDKTDDMVLVQDFVHPPKIFSMSVVQNMIQSKVGFFYERLPVQPILFQEKKVSLRTWVIPLRIHTPLLAYFGVGSVFSAENDFDCTSDEMSVHFPTIPDACFQDLFKHPGIPPKDILLPELKRISLFVLLSLINQEHAKQTAFSFKDYPPFLVHDIFCLDFEFEYPSHVWLMDWKGSKDCHTVKMQTVQCENVFRPSEAIKLVDEFVRKKNNFEVKLKYETSLELLVDETSYNDAVDDICDANPTPLMEFIGYRLSLSRKIKHSVFTKNGFPKTNFIEYSHTTGKRCSRCNYLNHDKATHCDACGYNLAENIASNKENILKNNKVDDGNLAIDEFISNDNIDSQSNYQSRLEAIFRKYDPSRLPNIRILLERYRGEEEKLITRLQKQYETLAKFS